MAAFEEGFINYDMYVTCQDKNVCSEYHVT